MFSPMRKFAIITISIGIILFFRITQIAEDKVVTPDFVPNVSHVIASKQVQSPEIAIESKSQFPQTFTLNVPFTSQAPHANWNMPYQEACEEAALTIAQAYLANETFTPDSADKKILDIINWEEKNKFPVDLNLKELSLIAKEYYQLKAKVYYDQNVTIENIKQILVSGHPIIIPAAGRKLGNPHFTPPGPQYHMLVIIGYDEDNFITNDPGTRFGASYKYSQQVLLNAIHDWNGSKDAIEQGRKGMMVLGN